MNEPFKNTESRYSTVLYHCQFAVTLEYEYHKKYPDVPRLAEITGYTEERILESLEFGKLDNTTDQINHSRKPIMYQ